MFASALLLEACNAAYNVMTQEQNKKGEKLYSGEVALTNTHRVPMSLTNAFDDTFSLCDEVAECCSTEELCRIIRKYHRFKKDWKLEKDSASSTRLSWTDSLGNKDILIVYKTN